MEKLSTQQNLTDVPPLVDFVPRVSPHLVAPRHIQPLCDAFERAFREPTKLLVNTPPQHGKSELAFHFIPWVLLQCPRDILFLTYSVDFAVEQMRRAKPIAKHSGLELDPESSRGLRSWRAANGGTLYATGIGGDITGRPGGIILIDDPIKDWVSAQSRTIREAADSWLQSSVLTRCHPDSSVILVQTRWHEDDISGRLQQRGWDVVNLPAINAQEEALWPEERPLEWLHEQREQLSAHIWSALYMGRPMPVGGALFNSPTLCTLADVPRGGRRAVGVDLAYAAKTRADYSVRLDLLAPPGGKRFYLTNVVRQQVKAPEFAINLKTAAQLYPGSPMRWYAAGTELGSADFIKAMGIPLDARNAGSDKFVRAQPVSVAWNQGRILVPADAPWASEFVNEVQSFTGAGDVHDDQVDALAAAYDALVAGAGKTGKVESVKSMVTKGLKAAY